MNYATNRRTQELGTSRRPLIAAGALGLLLVAAIAPSVDPPPHAQPLPSWTLKNTLYGGGSMGDLAHTLRIAVGKNGTLWAATRSVSPPNSSFLKFFPAYGPQGSSFSPSISVQSLTCINDSLIAVLGVPNPSHVSTCKLFDITGQQLASFTVDPLANNGGGGDPVAIAAGPDGRLYVLTSYAHIIVYHNSAFVRVINATTSFPSESTTQGLLVSVDEAGQLSAVVHVIHSSSDAYHLLRFDTTSGDNPTLNLPLPLAVPSALGSDQSGALCLAYSPDAATNADLVRVYSPTGALLLTQVLSSSHQYEILGITPNSWCDVFVAGCTVTSCRIEQWTTDADGDGVCDTWEHPALGVLVGTTGERWRPPNSDMLHKDLYVEVDAMLGHAPSLQALNQAVAHLATLDADSLVPPNPDQQDGITLHVELSDTTLVDAPLRDGRSIWSFGVLPIKQQYFAKADLDAGRIDLRRRKERVYKYCLFANTYEPTVSSPPRYTSGRAVMGGRDFFVALGRFADSEGGVSGRGTEAQQAGTFLHELGHTLGLLHGGDQLDNWKPNYKSVMNYAWQFPRFGIWSSWRPEFSTQRYNRLDLQDLSEPAGLGASLADSAMLTYKNPQRPPRFVLAAGSLDWNLRDGAAQLHVNMGDSLGYKTVGLGRHLTSPNDARVLKLSSAYPDTLARVTGTEAIDAQYRPAIEADPELTLADVDRFAEDFCDCNRNEVADWREIRDHGTADVDQNLIPDECERIRVAGLPTRLVACPSGDGGVLDFWADYDNLCTYDRFGEPTELKAVLRRGPASTVNVRDENDAVVDTFLVAEWAAGPPARARFVAGGAISGHGVVWFELVSRGQVILTTPECQVLSFDNDAAVAGAVDKFDLAALRNAFGAGAGSDFDYNGDSAVGPADTTLLVEHSSHGLASYSMPAVCMGYGPYAWGAFVPLAWARGHGDSARVTILLGRGGTGQETILGANLPDDGQELWPAYVPDAPRTDYYIRILRTAGANDGHNAYGASGMCTFFAVNEAAGCPTVDVLTTEGWATENTILGRSLSGQAALDSYRLRSSPDTTAGVVQVRIRENEEEHTKLDEVRMVTVDHLPHVRAYGVGRRVVVGTPVPAARVLKSTGEDITGLLNGTGAGYVGQPGDSIVVEMDHSLTGMASGMNSTDWLTDHHEGGSGIIDDGGGKGPQPAQSGLRRPDRQSAEDVDALILSTSGLLVQAPDTAGNWETLLHHYPRARPSEVVVDTVGYPRLRLIFVGSHTLRFVGRVVPSEEGFIATKLPLLGAVHSALGDVASAVSELGNLSTTLAPGDTVQLTFRNSRPNAGLVRDVFLFSNGVYTSNLPADSRPAGPSAGEVATLRQNEPNPFASMTSIRFTLSSAGRTTLEIFDLQGRLVRTLASGNFEAGAFALAWNRRADSGSIVSPGIYVCRLTSKGALIQRKVLVLP